MLEQSAPESLETPQKKQSPPAGYKLHNRLLEFFESPFIAIILHQVRPSSVQESTDSYSQFRTTTVRYTTFTVPIFTRLGYWQKSKSPIISAIYVREPKTPIQ